ncbi:MAG TPA: glycosyltransferase family 2 protein [Gemmatimonadaceae bacterium]|nr:glycosyltransferase family 2 protein [Gemmatimonadaceae bacterium]
MLTALLIAQLLALGVVATRLARGRHRLPAAEPLPEGLAGTTVTAVVPTRNEAHRVGACLAGLHRQGAPLVEVIVVDSCSADGTDRLVDEWAARDSRIRRIADPPLPAGHVGRPWALAAGFGAARGEWVLGIDADAAPLPGMVAGAVAAAERHALDVVSFAPRLRARTALARWLQPAFLTTLVYRFGPSGLRSDRPERALANGQCLLMRRRVLERAGGYAVATRSFCDDITIVRHLAAGGARVGFLDGPRLLTVEMYGSGGETWRAWPPSLGMRDATSPAARLLDSAFLVLAQGAPLAVLGALALSGARGAAAVALSAVNVVLFGLRLLVLAAASPTFERRGLAYWLSPLADLPATLRVGYTSFRRPQEWRGRALTAAGRSRRPAAVA